MTHTVLEKLIHLACSYVFLSQHTGSPCYKSQEYFCHRLSLSQEPVFTQASILTALVNHAKVQQMERWGLSTFSIHQRSKWSMDFLSAAGKPPSATFCISWPCENIIRWITGAGSFPPQDWLRALGTSVTIAPVEWHFMPFSTRAG